jgi:serine/threonine protein kinase
MDIWSLGCVLFELFTGESLFHCNSNLSLADPSQLATFSSPFLKKKLKKINSYKARELLMLMLEKHPSSRTDIGRVFSHSFFTDNKALSNVLNHSQQFDVFLSYRHFSDHAVADTIYTFLVSEGFSVYVDKVYNPNMSWYENVSYGLKNSRIFLPVVSRAAILNFGTITADSPADALLIQYRVAMEYKALNFIQDVVSVFVGDRDWSSGSYGNFLLQQCFPVFPDVVCKALEEIIACDVHIPDSSHKTLKQTCTSLLSLDSTYSMMEGWESKTVVCQGQVDSCLQDLKMKVVTTIAQLEEKECSDMSDDLLKKIKEISSLGFTITDKDGNKIKLTDF